MGKCQVVVSSLGRGRVKVGVKRGGDLKPNGFFITAEAGFRVVVSTVGAAITLAQPTANKIINKIKNKRKNIKAPFINAVRIIIGNAEQVNHYCLNSSN